MQQMTRQQIAGWILAIGPAVGLVGSIFNFAAAIDHLAAGRPVSGEFLGIALSAGFMFCILYLAVRLIKNDSYCRLAMVLYCLMPVVLAAFAIFLAMQPTVFFYVGFPHSDRPLVLIGPRGDPGAIPIHLAFLFLFMIYVVFFGTPLWLLARRPTAPLFGRARRDAA